MSHFVGLDVSQKMTAICVVDKDGRRIWRGQCPSVPEQISAALRRYAGDNARIGIETGAMTPWIVHELRNLGFEVVCLDARHARAALKMQINKNDRNDAAGWAQIVRASSAFAETLSWLGRRVEMTADAGGVVQYRAGH
jgi:transposase